MKEIFEEYYKAKETPPVDDGDKAEGEAPKSQGEDDLLS